MSIVALSQQYSGAAALFHSLGRTLPIQVSRVLNWKLAGAWSFFGFNMPLSSFHRNKWGSTSNTVSRFNITSSVWPFLGIYIEDILASAAFILTLKKNSSNSTHSCHEITDDILNQRILHIVGHCNNYTELDSMISKTVIKIVIEQM